MRLAKIITLTILMYIIRLNVFSQTPELEWERRYYGTDVNNNNPIALAVDSSGNSYVTGSVSIFGENSNIVTIKYNSAGVQQWVDLYNGPLSSNSIDVPIGIQLDKWRNVYICGYSESAGLGSNDYLTIKYNTAGTRLWTARYNTAGSFSDDPYGMTVDDSGNVYVTGISYNGTRNDALTIKYNTNGDSVWIRRFNPALVNTLGSAVVADAFGNAYVTIQSGFSMMLVKYNSVGVQQWSVTGPNCNNMKSVIDILGNIYIGGTTNQGMPLSSDFYVCKYDIIGSLVWSKTYNGPVNGHEGLRSMCERNGNLYVTGYSPGVGSQADYLTIKYNVSNGDSLWTRRYNSPGSYTDDPYAIIADNSENIYVTGYSANLTNGGDMITLKYNAIGIQQWALIYPYGAGHDIKLDPVNNDMFVFCSIRDVFNNGELVTIKYNPLVGILSQQNLIPNSYMLSQNYPNPFNPSTKIKFSIPYESITQLKIYDVLGRVVAIVVNEKLKAGTYEADFDASSLASGIYFYSLEAENFKETKKMVLLK